MEPAAAGHGLCYALALPAAAAAGNALVEPPAGNPVAPRERKVTLWLVLQALVVGLMLTVVPVLGVIGFRSDRRIIAALGQEIVRVTARDVSNRVSRLLEAGTRTARDLDLRATYGRLPLADDEQLATFLGDRLRYEPGIDRLFYGDAATGALVTVGRTPDGRIAATISDPDVEAGRPRTWCIAPDGSRTPGDLAAPVEVDARDRPWFRVAEQGDGRSGCGQFRRGALGGGHHPALPRPAERMKASLRSFARYVPTDVVRDLLASGEDARLGGEMRRISLHCSDIEGFTTISERLSPPQVVEYLAEYLELMTAAIRAEGGIVNQVIGDGILGLFNAPAPLAGHAAANCRAALVAQQALGDLRTRWQKLGRPLLRARIGLHVGDVMVGNFGTHEHLAYGVIGDAVNLSSRLEGLNKAYGTSIVASDELRAEAGAGFEWRTLDRVAVVGRAGGTLLCELLGRTGSVAVEALAARDAYHDALADYFAGRFDRAAAGFRDLSTARPADRAAATLAERAESLAHRPPERWDGVHLVASK